MTCPKCDAIVLVTKVKAGDLYRFSANSRSSIGTPPETIQRDGAIIKCTRCYVHRFVTAENLQEVGIAKK